MTDALYGTGRGEGESGVMALAAQEGHIDKEVAFLQAFECARAPTWRQGNQAVKAATIA